MLKTLPLPMTVVMCGGRRCDLKTLLGFGIAVSEIF